MKQALLSLLILLGITSSQEASGSILGGAKLRSSTAHHVGVGWPSVFYEWWHAGNPDWAIGGELVYGDWSGEFSDVGIGFGVNLPLKWHLRRSGKTDVAFRLNPGVLIGSIDRSPSDLFVFGGRVDFGIPVSIRLDPKVKLITGGTIPFSIIVVESADPFAIIPILGRIGVEVKANPSISPWLLIEVGPTIAAGSGGSNVEAGFRVFVGATFF